MIVIAVLFGSVLSDSVLRANARLQREERLPMQWWFDGEVTWSAPRPVALAFIPVLALLTLACLTILFFTVPPRPGQEGMVLPVLVGIGVMFVVVQHLHLWLIRRTLRTNGR